MSRTPALAGDLITLKLTSNTKFSFFPHKALTAEILFNRKLALVFCTEFEWEYS
jgi:hypothetical protein